MAYLTSTLITRAYYLSGVVARDLQTVTGTQINDGLDLLNAFLSFKSSDLRLIPYFSRTSFNTVAGQEDYFIPNLDYVDTLTFNIGDVRFSIMDMTRKEYFSTPRIDNVQSLPYSYRVERELGGSRIYLYFVPAAAYEIKISGKYSLSQVTLNQDLALTYDLFFIEFLRHGLADYICNDYGVTLPSAVMAKYQEIEKKMMDVSPADLSMTKRSYFNRGPVLDWQLCNIPGWIP